MGRVYVCPYDNLSVTTDADQDIFELVMGATMSGIFLGFELYAGTTSDERVRLRLCRRSTTGSGGSAASENPKDPGNTVVAAAAVSTLVTTPGTIGAILEPFYWSQLSPLIYLPPPELRETIGVSGRICLNLQTAVASTRNWSGKLWWEEL